MATSNMTVGYEFEFIDQVSEDYHDYVCRQCKHIAREPAIASCCTEVFCKACIEAIIRGKKPCSSCESSEIASQGLHKKYQLKIRTLRIHCSLKDRGCEWTGQLQHLDAHLDFTTGDCVYVDVECPSKCNQKVQKLNVDTHLANCCPNRDYTCPHCSFRATFHEVSDHFEVCRYYTLVCPNRCGASFERDVLEDHLNMCGLQKLQCEFSYAGCEASLTRNQQKEHMEQSSQKHLALVAAATKRIQEQQQAFEQILQTQQKICKQALEQKDAMIQSLEGQYKVLKKNLDEQKEEFHKQQKMYEEKLADQETRIKELEIKNDEKQQQMLDLNRKLENFRQEMAPLTKHVHAPPYAITLRSYAVSKKLGEVFSIPAMYTHPGGYAIVLKVFFNGKGEGYHTHISVGVYSIKGIYDDTLIFPVQFTMTVELMNQHRDQDHHRRIIECTVKKENIGSFCSVGLLNTFIPHAILEWNEDRQSQYLKNDCLELRVIEVLVN